MLRYTRGSRGERPAARARRQEPGRAQDREDPGGETTLKTLGGVHGEASGEGRKARDGITAYRDGSVKPGVHRAFDHYRRGT